MENEKINRREFLSQALRLGIAGILAGGLFALWLKRSPNRKNDSCATGSGVCRNCIQLESCRHPTALSFRKKGG